MSNLAEVSPRFESLMALNGMINESRALGSFTFFNIKSFLFRGSPLT